MKRIVKENCFFVFFCIVMSIYYLYRLFAITPWYDEVYTYITFIDKGFFYSITHWPLPNNHILFSALSSLLRPFGVYIALRGISYLSAIATLILVYGILKQMFGKGIANIGTLIYAAMYPVNLQAVQGRGYSFATFCFALSIYCVLQIVAGKEKTGRFYILYTIALYLGLYTLVSSMYWVFAVCVCGGLILLVHRRYGEFLKLVIYSLISAVLTFFSYSIVWLAIGSNWLIDHFEIYGQETHVSMILKNTVLCWKEGFGLMINNPYMQGIGDRFVFLRDFIYFGKEIIKNFWGITNNVLYYMFVCIILGTTFLFCFTVVKRIRSKQEKQTECTDFALSISGVGFLVIFVILLIQCSYPFARIFSFMGIMFALQIGLFIYCIQNFFRNKCKSHIMNHLLNIIVVIGCILCFISPAYNEGYSILDDCSHDAVKHVEWRNVNSYMTNDVYMKQQIQYHYILGKNMDIPEDYETPQVILLKKNMNFESWANIIPEEALGKYDLDSRTVLYENKEYIVYK